MRPRSKKRGQKLAKRWGNLAAMAREEGREHIQENLIERLPNARRVRLLMLEWVLLIIVILSLALTQAFWYTQSYSAQAYVGGGTYIEATMGRVNSLNPLFATTNSEKVLSKLMFATISTVDYSGHVGRGLADMITSDETGKVWTITLKDGLKWSDGEPITLEDVLYTVNLTKDPTINTSYSSNFAGVTVERVGDSIVFGLPSAYADFDATLNIPILPKHILGEVQPSQVLEHNFSTNPVTSGAFTFNAMQNINNDGERIIYLAANDLYYKSKPLLNSFAIHTYNSLDQIVSAVASSEVTATAELSASFRDQLSSDIVYEKQTSLASGIYAFFNTTSDLLSDVAVRRAIRQGIDLSDVRSVLDYEFALDYPILDSQIEIEGYPEVPEYDLAAARSALSGLAGRTLRLVTVDTGHFPEMAERLKLQLKALGFEVELAVYSANQEFIVNVIQPRAYDVLLYEVELGADPDLFAYYHSSQASGSGLNLSNYANSLVDDLILGARSSMDTAARATKYETFLNRWMSDVPAIGIYQSSMVYYFNKNARAFSEDNQLVYATDRFQDVENWAVNRQERNRTP